MPTTTERKATCPNCTAEFTVGTATGPIPRYCPTCQRAFRNGQMASAKRAARERSKRPSVPVLNAVDEFSDHLRAQLDRIVSDGPACRVVGELVELTMRAGAIREERIVDRLDVQRAVLGVARAEGASQTRAALIENAAVSLAWASRLGSTDQEGRMVA